MYIFIQYMIIISGNINLEATPPHIHFIMTSDFIYMNRLNYIRVVNIVNQKNLKILT